MLTAPFYNSNGEPGEPVQLPEELFDGRVHKAVLHQVVKAQLANRRQGNASTKTRGMVRGGNRKPWRQKGTGRARQGSIRAPHWRGGGVVFGPSPRSYRQQIPKKLNALARRSALNMKVLGERLAVIERFGMEAPKTRQVAELLGKIGMGGRKLLILTDGNNAPVYLSARNLQNVSVLPFGDASAYEMAAAGSILIESGALQAPPNTASEEALAHA